MNEKTNSSGNIEKKPIYLMSSNHFDPIWRRAFKKPFHYKGEKYVADEAIQDACISDWLTMGRGTDSSFEIECSLVLRTYLEKHPEEVETFRRLFAEKRFELLASGETIIDTNMPGGEMIVRNLMYGLLWGEGVFGEAPSTGCLNDAFGCSAQLPQIFRGCGVEWLMGLSYKFPVGDYWKGLDGTVIKISPNIQDAKYGFQKYLGSGDYYRPCKICKGEGCEACAGRGFEQFFRMDGELTSEGIDFDKSPFGLIYIGGEETMATMDLPEKVRKANASQNEIEYSFGLCKEIARKYYQKDIDATDACDPARIAPEIEGNPVQTGCMVSRIKCKQYVRQYENLTAAYEKLSSLALLNGGDYLSGKLLETWRFLALASFHDAITGTHIDVGYEEIMEGFDKSATNLADVLRTASARIVDGDSRYLTVFNPHAFPVTESVEYDMEGQTHEFLAADIPAFGFRTFEKTTLPIAPGVPMPDGTTVVENEYFRIRTDHHGILGIYDKSAKRELIHANKGYANELILEHDVGDPWSTREASRPRRRLGQMCTLTSVIRFADRTELTYKGKMQGNEKILTDPADYRILLLEWEQKVILRDGVKRVDFVTEILWDTFDRRIRISFPTDQVDDDGYYAVPFGVLRRQKYDRPDRPGVDTPDGNWPAVEWFSTARDRQLNVALLNRGTPCSRIENGEMLISVLRSPTFPSCLFWPRVYNAPVYDGMRDQGNHHFEYALTTFDHNFAEGGVIRQAYAYNHRLVAMDGAMRNLEQGLRISAQGVDVAAFKRAEDGNGLILRLNEFRGGTETVTITLPASVKSVHETNLLEKNASEVAIPDGKLVVEMRPFKLKTFRLEF